MKQRKRITLQTDVNATCAIRHTLALSVLGLGFLGFREEITGLRLENGFQERLSFGSTF